MVAMDQRSAFASYFKDIITVTMEKKYKNHEKSFDQI
jgi:hypothetical protein